MSRKAPYEMRRDRLCINTADNYIGNARSNTGDETGSGVTIKNEDSDMEMWIPGIQRPSVASFESEMVKIEEHSPLMGYGGDFIDLVSDDEDPGTEPKYTSLESTAGIQGTFLASANPPSKRVRPQQGSSNAVGRSTRAPSTYLQTRTPIVSAPTNVRLQCPAILYPYAAWR